MRRVWWELFEDDVKEHLRQLAVAGGVWVRASQVKPALRVGTAVAGGISVGVVVAVATEILEKEDQVGAGFDGDTHVLLEEVNDEGGLRLGVVPVAVVAGDARRRAAADVAGAALLLSLELDPQAARNAPPRLTAPAAFRKSFRVALS